MARALPLERQRPESNGARWRCAASSILVAPSIALEKPRKKQLVLLAPWLTATALMHSGLAVPAPRRNGMRRALCCSCLVSLVLGGGLVVGGGPVLGALGAWCVVLGAPPRAKGQARALGLEAPDAPPHHWTPVPSPLAGYLGSSMLLVVHCVPMLLAAPLIQAADCGRGLRWRGHGTRGRG